MPPVFYAFSVIFTLIVFAFIGVTIFKVFRSAKNQGGEKENITYDKQEPADRGSGELYKQSAEKFIKDAQNGDAEAQFNLAEVYEFHESDKYIYWLEKAAEQGYDKAIRTLADEYNYGNDSAEPPIKKDLEKAVKYLSILADKGDTAAMKDISLIYSVEYDDDDKAREWTERAASAGDLEAIEELGDDYRLNSGIADFDKSEYWYKKAAELGSGAAMKGLGDLYCYNELRHDYFKAEMWYKKALDAGYWFAYVRLGDMYMEGKGFTKDESMAFGYYKKAADKGDKHGKVKVAECYLSGAGVAQDEKKAVGMLQEIDDDFNGNYILGLCYLNGTGVNRDLKKAAELFAKCKYNEEAENKLGECYYFGYGVKEDRDEAHELWHKAAESGCEDAIVNLKTYFYETIEPCDNH